MLHWTVRYLQYRLNKFFTHFKVPFSVEEDGIMGPQTRKAIRIAKLCIGYKPAYADGTRTLGFYAKLLRPLTLTTKTQRERGLAYRKKMRKEASGYPNLRGDLDCNPELLRRMQRLAHARKEIWTVTSGRRTYAEQKALWDNRHSNPYPVAFPGTSRHETGNAADVVINGRAIQNVISRTTLGQFGLWPLPGDAVHIELP